MISTYYTNNVAADENFLDHMYRIVSYDYKDLIFLLHVRRYHELDPSQPILTRDGVGNLIMTWYRVELSIQMGSYDEVSLTTLKDRATQLLIKYKSGALVKQKAMHKGLQELQMFLTVFGIFWGQITAFL